MESYADALSLCDLLRETVMREAVRSLELPSGSRGLDAGCGIGSHIPRLAEAIGPGGHVTGVDLSSDHIARAREIICKPDRPEYISLRQGDVGNLSFEDNCFDWAWSVDCVGYPAVSSLRQVEELVRVVRPGGLIALAGWTSQQLLPGYPLLETRLNAPGTIYPASVKTGRAELHFMRAQGWLGKVGLNELQVRTFVGNIQAPLTADERKAVAYLFEMFWDGAQSDVSPRDWEDYKRLCRPESPDFILNQPDYNAFFTYTMFRGVVP
ncbi:MAG: methyltransferase domain-containing protein [Candidatus Zixiibacteriota bacterium]|nr:MAG: methyltransferase domain-containing protein [candidate division Zixibacteria bacterium]